MPWAHAQALAEAMAEEMRRDPAVVIWGLDVGPYGGAFGATRGLYEEFGPERVIDMPVSEAGYVGAGVGRADGGSVAGALRPAAGPLRSVDLGPVPPADGMAGPCGPLRPPAEFACYRDRARALGFRGVAAGPLVRSSHQADVLWQQADRPRQAA